MVSTTEVLGKTAGKDANWKKRLIQVY
ncbi:hypothetical protein [Bacillus cereus]